MIRRIVQWRPLLLQAILLLLLLLVDAAPPANDKCTQATELTINAAAAIPGTTLNASLDGWCGDSPPSWQGVWYVVKGTGLIVSVSTCSSKTDFDVDISIQTACGGGAGATCHPTLQFDFPSRCSNNNNGVIVPFQTELDKLYYIFVTGLSQGDKGSFEIVATGDVNDAVPECTAAAMLTIDGPEMTGSTVNSPQQSWCGGPVLWQGDYFVFKGNGKKVKVTTCSSAADFTTEIAIQTACLRFEPDCIAFSNGPGTCKKSGTAVELQTIKNQIYYVFVTGEFHGVTGAYGIRVLDADDEEAATNGNNNKPNVANINACYQSIQRSCNHIKCVKPKKYNSCRTSTLRSSSKCTFSAVSTVVARKERKRVNKKASTARSKKCGNDDTVLRSRGVMARQNMPPLSPPMRRRR